MSLSKNLKHIDEFPKYTVSKDGDVFNQNGHKLKPSNNYRGYPMVLLYDNGSKRLRPVHRLVAEAYIPNPEGKRTVNHIDGNKKNNRVSNLEWATDSENMKHAYVHELRKSHLTHEDRKKGALISGEKSKKPVRVIETGKVYPGARECAEDLKCYVSAIHRCCKGLANHHHGHHFEYAE